MRIKPNKKSRLSAVLLLVLAIVSILLLVFIVSERGSAPKSKKPQAHKVAKEKPQGFDKTQFSTTDPSSLWIVVNKPHPLNPQNFTPSDLASVDGQQVSSKMTAQLTAMIADAKNQGILLRTISGYRSYSYQASLYNSYVKSDGQAQADTYSARPGHSEHQTGLAVDMGGAHGCDVQQCFGKTPEGIWLANHASKYGFIVRYTESNQGVTGYQAEPWHLRFIGVELVNEMNKQRLSTLEEFFGITGGVGYIN
jgi:D-alanyl-D-alanine carboxypeptidase